MDYLTKNSRLAKLAVMSLGLVLAGCSSDSGYKRQASGNDAYLKAPAPEALHVPAGLSLPAPDGTYAIPNATGKGSVGLQLDIRPPSQPLALVAGSNAQYSGNTASLLLNEAAGQSLWSEVAAIVKGLHYPVDQQNDASQTITTGWIQWDRKDENTPYRARYQISVQSQGYQQQLAVKLISLQQADKPVTLADEVQRYSTLALNQIAAALETRETQRQNAKNQQSAGQLDVQSGADDVGLPVLIVRGSFNLVWSRLPAALAKIGMKVTESNRPQGNIAVTYSPLSDAQWQALGARDPGLPSGKYKLQVGDLENRSSLQFIDSKGHTLTQSQNDALVAVFQAAFN